MSIIVFAGSFVVGARGRAPLPARGARSGSPQGGVGRAKKARRGTIGRAAESGPGHGAPRGAACGEGQAARALGRRPTRSQSRIVVMVASFASECPAPGHEGAQSATRGTPGQRGGS
jgi:hypothetical protein